MKTLKLAKDLTLPVDVVTQTIAILAKRRAGKSYTMRRLVEQLHHAGQQIVLVDPKGDQWGIRSAADGKKPGLPIVILGGERADVPLEPSSGEIVAKLVVEERVSVLLDLSLFRKHEVATFMTAFLENLYRLKAREIFRTPMMLVIDEADAIAPQKPQKGQERMLGAAEDIVRRGGQRGIGCVLVTQRSAVLNKNVLTQAQVLVALRTIAPQDLDAMNAWIDVHGTAEQKKALMESLPSLPVGDAWFWSPGWPTVDGIFKRVHVLPIETFDSGASPKPGEKRAEPKNVADVDLDALKRQMSATIEKAKADDPRELRRLLIEKDKQIKQLQAQKTPAAPVRRTEIQKVEVPVVTEKVADRLEKVCERLERTGTAHQDTASTLFTLARELRTDLARAIAAPQRVTIQRAKVDNRPALSKPAHIMRTERTPPRPPASSNGNGTIPIGEAKILTVCAQYDDGATREQLTILTGYKKSSRNAYILRLAQKGLVEDRGERVLATDAGVAALGTDFEPLPTGDALRQYWLQRLPVGERAVLEQLLDAYPKPIDREELTNATGYKKSSRNAYIQRLTVKRLVEQAGHGLKASNVLFD